MPSVPPSSSANSAKPSVDVRTLSLAQLHKLAARGSRRAKAELEGRMRAAQTAPAAPSAPVQPPPAASAAPLPPVRPPVLTERAQVPPPQRPLPASPPQASVNISAHTSANASAGDQALVQQLELIARQDSERARLDGPPRLVGMVMLAWSALVLMGGLLMLSRGGTYYLVGGLGMTAVGWLLLRCSQWALYVHGALLLLSLGWAWHSTQGSLGTTLAQVAPIGMAALWMLARPVREPLQ